MLSDGASSVAREFFSYFADRYGEHSLAISVRAPQGQYGGATGATAFGGQTACTLDTRFPIGCVMKTFLATVVVREVERGNIDLSAPIGRYLPIRRHSDVTIRQLLNHSSGIQDDIERLPRRLENDELIKNVEGFPRLFRPGNLFSYCNSGYLLLGAIIERVRGRSWQQLLRDEVLSPLNINDPVSFQRNHAVEHLFNSKRSCFRPINWNYPEYRDPAGSGRTRMSVSELVEFGSMFVERGQERRGVLTKLGVREMLEEDVAIPSDDDFCGSCLGWFKSHSNAYYSRGTTLGGAALLMVVPAESFAMAIATNREARFVPIREIMNEVLSAFGLSKYRGTKVQYEAESTSCADADSIIGSYTGELGTITLAKSNDGIEGTLLSPDKIGHAKFGLTKRNRDFFICHSAQEIPFGALIFLRGSDGSITHVRTNWSLSKKISVGRAI